MPVHDDGQALLAAFSELCDWLASRPEYASANMASGLHAFAARVVALLQELQRKGVPVSSATAAVVHGLSEQHQTHQLRYTVLVDDGTRTYWPPLCLVFAVLEELLLLTRLSTHGV
jgi:hypothetical protein